MAERKGVSVGSALSELARRGFKGSGAVGRADGMPVFRVSPDAEPITSDDVRRGLGEWP